MKLPFDVSQQLVHHHGPFIPVFHSLFIRFFELPGHERI